MGRTLLPYQVEAVDYALARVGTIIADDMGLGKTAEALGVINADTTIEKVLIVCPLSLVANWWKEIEEWLTRTGLFIVVKPYSQLHKVGTTYWDLVIFDEAHFIKNPKTERAQAAKRIAGISRRRILLTGTPFENRVSEIWPLLILAAPDYWNPTHVRPPNFLKPLPSKVVLGTRKAVPEIETPEKRERTNFYRFAMRYCGPVKKWIVKGGKRKAVHEFNGGSNLPELNRRLRESCLIRRLKTDVLKELPPKIREIVVMPSKLSELEHVPLLSGIGAKEITVSNYDSIVHQLHSNKVAFQEWSRMRHSQGVEKLPHVIEHVKNLVEQGQKLVLFAHHADVIFGLQLALGGSLVVTGETPAAMRQRKVDQFQADPNSKVFIGSIRAAGTGLTLTAATMVVFVEIDPNPGIMNQCEDRAHRLGRGKAPLVVQYLVSERSIDARLCQILAKKQDLLTRALNVDSSAG